MPVYGDEWMENWNKIANNSSTSVQQKYDFHRRLKEKIRALSDIRTAVEQDLITYEVELLVNVISSGNDSTLVTKLNELLRRTKIDYDIQFVGSIFSGAIKKVFPLRKLHLLSNKLWRIHQQNKSEYLEIILLIHLHIYSTLREGRYQYMDNFQQIMAYRLYNMRNDHQYNNTDESLKSNVDTVIAQLPNNLRHFYFEQYFCLSNVRYLTYIYTATKAKVDQNSRYIWLWNNTKTMDETGYIKAEIQEFDSTNDESLKVNLKGALYNMYYYMMADNHTVAGWDSSTTPPNHTWTIDFLDADTVGLSQNGWSMCAEEEYNSQARNVRGRQHEPAFLASPECLWYLGQCIF